MSDIVDRLRDPINQDIPFTELMLDAAARIEQLEAALREVIEAWDWWQVDTYDRDGGVPAGAVDEARAALAAPSGALEERT